MIARHHASYALHISYTSWHRRLLVCLCAWPICKQVWELLAAVSPVSMGTSACSGQEAHRSCAAVSGAMLVRWTMRKCGPYWMPVRDDRVVELRRLHGLQRAVRPLRLALGAQPASSTL